MPSRRAQLVVDTLDADSAVAAQEEPKPRKQLSQKTNGAGAMVTMRDAPIKHREITS